MCWWKGVGRRQRERGSGGGGTEPPLVMHRGTSRQVCGLWPLIIGGVHVEHPLGLAGHSDADVLAHAITDALLGAAGLGDIGHHFPDTDPAFKGADSMVLLKEAMAAVRARGWRLGNIDATIIAQQPKMKPWLPGMITALSAAIGCHPAQINVKAKTNEKVGTVGRCESIAALASALLVR